MGHLTTKLFNKVRKTVAIFTTEIINIGSGSVAIRELFNLDWRLSEMQLTVILTSRSPPSILQTLYGRDFKFHGRAENRREN
jgi:hypothetical protein